MAGEQILKRIPKIKFPDRRRTASAAATTTPQPPATAKASGGWGSASIQPKRIPIAKDEIDVITMGGSPF